MHIFNRGNAAYHCRCIFPLLWTMWVRNATWTSVNRKDANTGKRQRGNLRRGACEFHNVNNTHGQKKMYCAFDKFPKSKPILQVSLKGETWTADRAEVLCDCSVPVVEWKFTPILFSHPSHHRPTTYELLVQWSSHHKHFWTKRKCMVVRNGKEGTCVVRVLYSHVAPPQQSILCTSKVKVNATVPLLYLKYILYYKNKCQAQILCEF